MKEYNRLNLIIGWSIFAVASLVYLLTIEPTVSFWDAGERIAVSYKLQIGHPPGAPLFQMIGRVFTLFAFGDLSKVAMMMNAMSALCSGFTVLFFFWSATMLLKKLATKNNPLNNTKMYAIFGSAVVGAMALTFSDTFWFISVESEVYAMSTFLTAFVFWSMLRWETQADNPNSLRWIVLISFIIGLSIGVHMLNLLAIPALVFIYYFKKYTFTKKGFLLAFLSAVGILGFVQGVFIPWFIKLDWIFERFFVNTLRLPFHSGTIIYFIVVISAIVYGLHYTRKKGKVIANTIILCFTFIVIGYTSFFMLVIRSNAKVPINENAPVDALGLVAYLGREQYGDWPKLYGPYYNAPVIGRQDGKPVYRKDRAQGRYVIVDERKGILPEYDERFKTIFPRMHGTRADQVSAYKKWGKVRGVPIEVRRQGGEREVLYRPTFGENLRFFFSYQVGHMYFRYFMWNFAGRQNDYQGHGSPLKGNWLSGLGFLDEPRIGPQSNLPYNLANNKGRNNYYMLPLILGLTGFFFHYRKNYKDAIVVSLLFFMTGLAIILYLNQTPYQPRERDYSYAASFFAFSIWIAFGVYAIIDKLKEFINGKVAVVGATLITLILVPGIMAKENWDDHDRSGRYTARDVAYNYLNSCAPNAILFTNGDNDTFPLWYLQEVEGIRTDVKVVNLSLLNTDWYINDMMRRKFYEADPIPLTMTPDRYIQGTRDVVYIIPDERVTGYVDLRELVDFAASDSRRFPTPSGPIDYFPTNRFRLPVDSAKVVDNGTVPPELAHKILPALEWAPDVSLVMKNHFIVLDLLATNNWERPIYFAITTGRDSYIGLEPFFQIEGLAYRLLPIRSASRDGQIGRINTDILYENMMNRFKWGNMNDPSVYMSEDNRRLAMNFRNNFARLSRALINENKMDSAIAVIDRCFEIMPEESVPFNFYILPLAENYYRAGAIEKGNAITKRLIEIGEAELRYYFQFAPKFRASIEDEKQMALGLLQRIYQITDQFGQEELAQMAEEVFDNYYQLYTMHD